MSWARLDDRFPWHPKVLAAGNAAIGLWVRCLVHCCAHATQGFVDDAMAKRMGTARELQAVTEAKLWVRVSGGESCTVTGRRDSGKRPLPDVTVTMPGPGFWIRDFLHYHWRDEAAGATERKPQTASAPSPSRRETRRNGAPSPTVSAVSPEISHAVSPAISSETQVSKQVSRICARSEISTSTSTVPLPPQTPPSGDGVVAPQPEPETPASAAEQAVVDRLDALGWRSKMRAGRFAAGWGKLALRIVREQDLTVDAIDELLLEAKERSKGDPMDLLGTWINPDKATWKEVLADRAYRVRHADAVKRGRAAAAIADRDVSHNGDPRPIRDLGPIYDERKTT
jgi:hypothetical protein